MKYLEADWLQQLADKLVGQGVTLGIHNFSERNKDLKTDI
jgi:hypothetical protein